MSIVAAAKSHLSGVFIKKDVQPNYYMGQIREIHSTPHVSSCMLEQL